MAEDRSTLASIVFIPIHPHEHMRGGAMDNPRPEKVAIVEEVKGRLAAAEAVMVTEYRGLSVDAMSQLRINLRPAGGSYKVYKNTLVRRAAEGLNEEFSELLVGPTALAFTETTPEGAAGDVVTVAKTLKDFAKDNPDLIVKGGLFEGQFIDADGLKQLAEIEPREVLLAKLAGAISAPMTQLAGLLQALPRDMAYGLKALIDQGGAPGAPAAVDVDEAPAEEAAAEEAAAPADEAPATEAAAEEATQAPAADAAEETAADAANETEES
jgi:large subunit ribosomal protein L10